MQSVTSMKQYTTHEVFLADAETSWKCALREGVKERVISTFPYKFHQAYHD